MDEPAFPEASFIKNSDGTIRHTEYHPGMTLRDYFAAKAMVALIDKNKGGAFIKSTCVDAYQFADCMLKERGV